MANLRQVKYFLIKGHSSKWSIVPFSSAISFEAVVAAFDKEEAQQAIE